MRRETAQLRKEEPWFPSAYAALEAVTAGEGTDDDWEAVAPFFWGRWDDEARRSHAAASQQRNDEAARLFASEDGFAPEATLAALLACEAPALLLAGEFDLNSPPQSTAEFAGLFPDATFVTQQGAGHFPWLDDAERFVATTAKFLGSPGAAQRGWLNPIVRDLPSTNAARRTAEAVWRMEAPRLIAGLARVTGDLGEAEELAQEAFVVALEQWPTTGIPPNPAGWLMTTAKNRAIDGYRKQAVAQRKLEMMGREAKHRQDSATDVLDERVDDHIGDDLLRMVFTACHPALSMEVRVALTLRCVGGLTTEEIARAFLISTATAAQRIVRAKRTLTAAGVTFRMPTPEEMSERLAAVLEVVYLMFNEGYSATAGADLLRPALSEEAVRLGRVLASLIPEEPEVHGLLALMELQASRTAARTGPGGIPVLLADQDRRLWDRLLIRRGLASLARAETLGGPIGPYTLQAGIAACHARADRVESTDWARIVSLYDVLRRLWDSPVVDLNRAVAVGMAEGPAAGLAAAQAAISTSASMRDYPHAHLVVGDMLSRLGRSDEAQAAFDRAADLTQNEQQRALFSRRADEQR